LFTIERDCRMTAKKWAFEDFFPGQTIDLGETHVTAAEMIAFASEFDFQPMHLDEEAGKASILGGLSASGWHTCSMLMRMMCDSLLLDSTSQGAPGIDYLRWKKPVLAGDTLKATGTVVATRPSSSRPGLGLVTMRYAIVNQRGETVLEMQNSGMFRARGVAA